MKAKIEEEAKLPVIIPEYGQTYTLDDNLTMEQTVAPIAIQSSAKREVLDKIKLLKNELNDMESIVREDYLSKKDNENEISLLKLRLKEIEDQIVKIVETINIIPPIVGVPLFFSCALTNTLVFCPTFNFLSHGINTKPKTTDAINPIIKASTDFASTYI